MRAALIVIALLGTLALTGGSSLRETELEWTRASASAPPAASFVEVAPPIPVAIPPAEPCEIALHATATQRHVALAWTDCPDVETYTLWRGPSAAELVPFVEVNHASHVDRPDRPMVYAVQIGTGPLSEPVAVAWG